MDSVFLGVVRYIVWLSLDLTEPGTRDKGYAQGRATEEALVISMQPSSIKDQTGSTQYCKHLSNMKV